METLHLPIDAPDFYPNKPASAPPPYPTLTKVRSLGYFYIGAIRQQHPHRNFQASPRWVDDRDRAISPLRPADHLKGGALERVEPIENLDGRVFYAQGIVSVDACTLMSI